MALVALLLLLCWRRFYTQAVNRLFGRLLAERSRRLVGRPGVKYVLMVEFLLFVGHFLVQFMRPFRRFRRGRIVVRQMQRPC